MPRRFLDAFDWGSSSKKKGGEPDEKQPNPDSWKSEAMERIRMNEGEHALSRQELKDAGIVTTVARADSKEPVCFTFPAEVASPSVRAVQGMPSATRRGSWSREVNFATGIGREYGPGKADSANKHSHVLTQRADGMVLIRSSIEYDANGSLVRQRVLNYDDGGRLVNASLVDGDGNVLEEETHMYGEDGILRKTELVQYNHPDAEGKEVEYVTTYTPPHQHEKDSIMWMSESTLRVDGDVRKEYEASGMTEHLGKGIPQKHPVSGIPAGTASARLWL